MAEESAVVVKAAKPAARKKITPLSFCLALVTFGAQDVSPNPRGNVIYRYHLSSERYDIDFAADFKEEGWEQFDTNQDAYYFGVWVNRPWRLTLSYTEGDWTLVDCPTDESYFAEIRDMIRCYGEGFIAIGYSFDEQGLCTGRETLVQDRKLFLAGAP